MMTHFSKSYHAHVSTCEIAILLLRLHSFVFSYCDMFLLWRWMLLFFRSSWNTGQTGQMPMHCGTCACTWACAWVPRPVPEVSRSQHRSEAVSRQASSSDGYWICFWITICQTQPQYLQIVQCCPVVSISQWQSAEPVSISICSTSASSSFWSLFGTTSWYETDNILPFDRYVSNSVAPLPQFKFKFNFAVGGSL